MRKQIYAKHGYCCAACGVRSRDAIIPANFRNEKRVGSTGAQRAHPLIKPWLEAHERFEIDYAQQKMILIGMEPLCHACHAFVHSGLLELRLFHKKISKTNVARILGNGVGVLEETGGTMPLAAAKLCNQLGLKHGLKVANLPPATRWAGWSMEWKGKEYPSPFPTEAAWRREMSKTRIN
jgi:hypothetical protein